MKNRLLYAHFFAGSKYLLKNIFQFFRRLPGEHTGKRSDGRYPIRIHGCGGSIAGSGNQTGTDHKIDNQRERRSNAGAQRVPPHPFDGELARASVANE